MRAMLTTVTMIAALTCVGMASDGVIEINQARALTGGVTPSDKPGFPVAIDSPGSYRLTSDLNVAGSAFGIGIETSHVTIDLNGFAVIGTAAAQVGIGATHPTFDDIAIVNGVVTGFRGNGIALEGRRVRLERLRVIDTGGISISGEDALVADCTVVNAPGNAIQVFSGLVRGNVISLSGTGLSLGPSAGYAGNVLRHNTTNITGGVTLGSNLCDKTLCP